MNLNKINIGDLVTLKGMSNINEKPIGMVKKIWTAKKLEIFWINENIAKRYALLESVDANKLEIVSKASQQSP